MRRTPLIAVVAIAVTLLGCSGKSKSKDPAPAATTSAASISIAPSSSTPPSNNPADAQRLAVLAAKAAAASYDATYDFNAVRTKGLLRIFAAPPRYRVDISIGPRTAQFFRIDVGTVSCAQAQGKPVSCALVAGPGEKVPDVFDPGVQRLFTDGLDALAKDPAGFAIAAIPETVTPKPGVATGTCFHVERLADLEPVSPGTVTPPGKGFEAGDYCFDPATAVLTSVRVATGTLSLNKAPGMPATADFTPPAPAQPLEPAASSAAAATPSPS